MATCERLWRLRAARKKQQALATSRWLALLALTVPPGSRAREAILGHKPTASGSRSQAGSNLPGLLGEGARTLHAAGSSGVSVSAGSSVWDALTPVGAAAGVPVQLQALVDKLYRGVDGKLSYEDAAVVLRRSAHAASLPSTPVSSPQAAHARTRSAMSILEHSTHAVPDSENGSGGPASPMSTTHLRHCQVPEWVPGSIGLTGPLWKLYYTAHSTLSVDPRGSTEPSDKQPTSHPSLLQAASGVTLAPVRARHDRRGRQCELDDSEVLPSTRAAVDSCMTTPGDATPHSCIRWGHGPAYKARAPRHPPGRACAVEADITCSHGTRSQLPAASPPAPASQQASLAMAFSGAGAVAEAGMATPAVVDTQGPPDGMDVWSTSDISPTGQDGPGSFAAASGADAGVLPRRATLSTLDELSTTGSVRDEDGVRTAAESWHVDLRALGDALLAASRVGMPHAWRPELWWRISGAAARCARAAVSAMAKLNSSDMDPAILTSIMKDEDRTWPRHAAWQVPGTRRSLRRVLLALAAAHPDCGYSQGMNFLAAAALLHLQDEERAFWLVDTMMTEMLPPLWFSSSLLGCVVEQLVLEHLVLRGLPQLSQVLRRLSMPLRPVTLSWLLVAFTTALPSPVWTAVWDAIMCWGADVLLRVSLVLLWLHQGHMLRALEQNPNFDFASMYQLLQEAPAEAHDPVLLLMCALPRDRSAAGRMAAAGSRLRDMVRMHPSSADMALREARATSDAVHRDLWAKLDMTPHRLASLRQQYAKDLASNPQLTVL